MYIHNLQNESMQLGTSKEKVYTAKTFLLVQCAISKSTSWTISTESTEWIFCLASSVKSLPIPATRATMDLWSETKL